MPLIINSPNSNYLLKIHHSITYVSKSLSFASGEAGKETSLPCSILMTIYTYCCPDQQGMPYSSVYDKQRQRVLLSSSHDQYRSHSLKRYGQKGNISFHQA